MLNFSHAKNQKVFEKNANMERKIPMTWSKSPPRHHHHRHRLTRVCANMRSNNLNKYAIFHFIMHICHSLSAHIFLLFLHHHCHGIARKKFYFIFYLRTILSTIFSSICCSTQHIIYVHVAYLNSFMFLHANSRRRRLQYHRGSNGGEQESNRERERHEEA